MHVMMISTHHAESCPVFNKEVRKTADAIMEQLPTVLEKNGVKMVGAWVDMGAHTYYTVYETPSMDAYMACLNDPNLMGWLTFNTVENRLINSLEEYQAILSKA